MLLFLAHTLGLIPFLLAMLETFSLGMAACGVYMDVLQGEQHFLLWFWRWQTVNPVFKAVLMVFQPYSHLTLSAKPFTAIQQRIKEVISKAFFLKINSFALVLFKNTFNPSLLPLNYIIE